MVFYRKYRPQNISELDLDAVREKLTAILSSKNTPHAFLFTGPKGLGKTSSARILAKAINCESKLVDNNSQKKKSKKEKGAVSVENEPKTSSFEPCNACDACVSITNGSNIDVLEIDAASNRGIDEIRELRERVKFAPSNLSKKIYIIDEVHMLTSEAFNALLKTLEEPPTHVVFILATTEVWKLPPTIISRTFHVQFDKPTRDEVVKALKRVVAGENLDVEDGVLEKIFSLCDGAFRDAHKILEELVLASGGARITLDLLEKAYKTDSIDHDVGVFLDNLSKKNVKDALLAIGKMADSGSDFKIVTEKAVEKLRLLLLVKNGFQKDTDHKDLTFEIVEVEMLLEAFNQAYKELRFSVLPQLPLELLTVKWCMVRKSENQQVSSTSAPKKEEKTEEKHTQKEKVEVEVIPVGDIQALIKPQPVSSPGADDTFIKTLIDRVKRDNFSVAGVLRSVKLVKIGDTDVEVTTPYKFHGEKLMDGKVQKILEQRAAEILGKNVKFVVSVKEK